MQTLQQSMARLSLFEIAATASALCLLGFHLVDRLSLFEIAATASSLW